MVKVYLYNEQKEFTSEQVALVNEFGEFICPENGTFVEVLPEISGYKRVFDGKNWEYVEIVEPEPYKPTPEEEKQQKINELKNELNATDYKIIKCSECNLAGEPLPYDIKQLHAQRQEIRNKINELENA